MIRNAAAHGGRAFKFRACSAAAHGGTSTQPSGYAMSKSYAGNARPLRAEYLNKGEVTTTLQVCNLGLASAECASAQSRTLQVFTPFVIFTQASLHNGCATGMGKVHVSLNLNALKQGSQTARQGHAQLSWAIAVCLNASVYFVCTIV